MTRADGPAGSSRLMSARRRGILKELIITMCADDRAVLNHVRLQRVILRTERFVSELPAFYFMLFNAALYLFQFALPPISWKIAPFTWMRLERRLAYLEEWQSSRFYFKRALFKMIAAVCVSHLYSERRLLASLGFEPSMQHRSAGRLPPASRDPS